MIENSICEYCGEASAEALHKITPKTNLVLTGKIDEEGWCMIADGVSGLMLAPRKSYDDGGMGSFQFYTKQWFIIASAQNICNICFEVLNTDALGERVNNNPLLHRNR